MSSRDYTWENNGNLLSIADSPEVGTADTQCFGYDALQRLTSAWTPKTGPEACAATPTVASLDGPAPYWTDWTIDTLGNRTKQVEHTATGDKTTDYTVPTPGPGVVRPHAVTATSTTLQGQSTPTPTAAFTYDESGNTLTRPGQTLTWDSEGRQATIAENGVTTTSNLYDADGGRLVHRDKTGTTLYLPGQELKVPTGGSATATRYYSFGDRTIATRTPAAQSLSWLFGDHQGTQSVNVNASTQKVTLRRQQPYGESRGETVQWPTVKGFVGGDIDASGLTNVGARVYDPGLGRFLSVDPVQDLMDPQQWNGYSYANNSPITLSDPSGLRPDCGNGGGISSCNNAVPVAPKARKPGRPSGWSDNNTKNRPAGFSNRHSRHGVKVTTRNDGRQSVNNIVMPKGGPDLNKLLPRMDEYAQTDMLGDYGCAAACAWEAYNYVFLACVTGEEECSGKFLAEVQFFRGVAMCLEVACSDGAANYRAKTAAKSGTTPKELKPEPAQRSCMTNSFAPQTLVLMADGSTKKIADVKVGDKVFATDPETGRTRSRVVTARFVNDDRKLTDITVRTSAGNRALIRTTDEHPFWDESTDEWANAGTLTTDSELRAKDGSRQSVLAVRSYSGTRWMYNLTVADLHTYYVLAGNTPVLVHNAGGDKLRPDYNAEGPHGTFIRDKGTGQIKKWATWIPQTNPRNPAPWEMVERFDLQGPAHTNRDGTKVPTPHVNLPNGGDARPAQPWEIPGSGVAGPTC